MATIHDVAKLAGVSIKTVSRVVNQEPSVREATRERVQNAVDKLQYKPHTGARLMRSSKSNLIGLVTSAISTVSRDPVKAGLSSIHIVKGVQQACREAGKTLLIIDTEPDETNIQHHIDILLSHRVEGIIYVLDHHQLLAPPAVQNTPFWLVNGYSSPTVPAVVPDDYTGQQLAVEHLISQGHKRIAYVGLAVELEAGRLRREGFINATYAAGLSSDDIQTNIGMRLGESTPFSILGTVLQQLFMQTNPPTAICFGNDQMAVNAIPMLNSLGLRIPEDVSIMGFDNDMALVSGAKPELTTVTLPYQRMGQITAKKLLQGLHETEKKTTEPYPIKVTGEVVIRQSVEHYRLNSQHNNMTRINRKAVEVTEDFL